MQLLSFDKAKSCTRAYMRIKLSFVPGVGFDDFDALSAQEKAAVNSFGYKRYLEWRLRNAAQVNANAKGSSKRKASAVLGGR